MSSESETIKPRRVVSESAKQALVWINAKAKELKSQDANLKHKDAIKQASQMYRDQKQK